MIDQYKNPLNSALSQNTSLSIIWPKSNERMGQFYARKLVFVLQGAFKIKVWLTGGLGSLTTYSTLCFEGLGRIRRPCLLGFCNNNAKAVPMLRFDVPQPCDRPSEGPVLTRLPQTE